MKYSRLVKKVIIYVFIAVLVLAVGLAANRGSFKNKYADYTTYNTGDEGIKALYLLTGEMGYNRERFKRPVRFTPDGCVLVVIKPDWDVYMDELETKYLKEWIQRGNTLIFIDDDSNICGELLGLLNANNEAGIDGYDGWSVYSAGKGKLYLNNSCEAFTNLGLKSYQEAAAFIHILDIEGGKYVLFSEYYHGMGTAGVTVWDIIGTSGILVLIQLIIGIAVFVFVLSRRFGKPVTVFETVKRKENENIFALSNVYARAKAYTLVLEAILRNFKGELSKFLGLKYVQENSELIAAAAGNKFLNEMELKGLLERCSHYIGAGGGSIKELVYLVQWIEKIRKGIK